MRETGAGARVASPELKQAGRELRFQTGLGILTCMLRRSYISVALATLFFATASALTEQPWFVHTWQSDEGLPDNTVIGVDQSQDGFLWVVTYNGLVRFDGLGFREFPLQLPGIKAGMNRGFCADRSGRIWVASDPGVLVCLEQGKLSAPVTPGENAPSKSPRMVVEDGEGAIWVSYKDAPLMRIKDGKVRTYTNEDVLGQSTEGAIPLAVDQQGELWFFAQGRIGVFRKDRFVILGKTSLPFKCICAARGGGVWLGSDTSLARYTEAGGLSEPVNMSAEITRAELITCIEDRAGRIWLGTRFAGLFCLDGTDFKKVGMFQQPVLCLKEDRDGTIWVGTRGGGLKQVTPKIAELMSTSENTVFSGVQSLCKDTKGRLWAINWNQGKVLCGEGGAWIPLSPREGWTLRFATCVAAEPGGGIWIGTQQNGLFLWRDGAVICHFSATNGLAGNEVRAIRTTPAGAVWIGGRVAEGPEPFLHCWTEGQFQRFALPSETGAIMAIEVDASGDCWIATSSGHLLRIRGARLTDETPTLLAEPFQIRTLLATPDSSLWIGFGGRGLGRLKGGQFTRCRREQGLPDDYISQILADGKGRLWLAGNRGLFSLSEKDWEAFAEGRAPQLQSVAFQKKEGMPGLIASFDAWPNAFRDAEGRLYFAMQSGVATLYPDAVGENPLPPKVVIDRVSANGKVVALYGASGDARSGAGTFSPVELGQAGAHLHLAPGRRQVEIDFTAPVFRMPESIRFKYQLQGLDREWIEAGTRRSVLYSQLAPGHYRFQVIACNRDGVWNEQGASLGLTIPPFWWETGWFRIGWPLCAFGFLGSLVILWLRQRQQSKTALLRMQGASERERVRISQDLHDDLGAGLTEIALLSEVVRRSREKPETVATHARRIFASSNEMIQALDEIVWSINPANDTLDKLIAFISEFAQALSGSAAIRCRLDVPANVPDWKVTTQVRHQICMVVKECLTNVIKHARAQTVTLRIRMEGKTLEVAIEDDGVGFDPGAVRDATGTHDGLSNMRRRVSSMNGTFELHAVPGQGTRVRLTLGLSQ